MSPESDVFSASFRSLTGPSCQHVHGGWGLSPPQALEPPAHGLPTDTDHHGSVAEATLRARGVGAEEVSEPDPHWHVQAWSAT